MRGGASDQVNTAMPGRHNTLMHSKHSHSVYTMIVYADSQMLLLLLLLCTHLHAGRAESLA
jgi:hypothetical protein